MFQNKLLITILLLNVLLLFPTNQSLASSGTLYAYTSEMVVDADSTVEIIAGFYDNGWKQTTVTIRDLTTGHEMSYSLLPELSSLPFEMDDTLGTHTIQVSANSEYITLSIAIRRVENFYPPYIDFEVSERTPNLNHEFFATFTLNEGIESVVYPPDTAFFYVKTFALEGNPVIGYAHLPEEILYLDENPLVMDIPLLLPAFFPLGDQPFAYGLIGDNIFFDSEYNFSLYVIDGDPLININLDKDEVDRSSNEESPPLEVNLYLGGIEDFSVNEYSYQLSLLNGDKSYSLGVETNFIRKDMRSIVTIPMQAELGPSQIKVTVYTGNTILCTNQTNILIFDEVKITLSANNTYIKTGDWVHYDIFTTLEDRPN